MAVQTFRIVAHLALAGAPPGAGGATRGATAMKRDLAIVAVLWLALTVAGVALARVDFFPVVRADKGDEIRHAFQVLLYLAAPVFALVVAVLAYSVLRFRHSGPPAVDGPPIMGRGVVPVAWFGVTAALAVLVMVYPGLTGIPKVFRNPPPDLVVQVQGTRWRWIVLYPQYRVTTLTELVLPVDTTVRFEVTSPDVVHSFWIPAFLTKIDAVPGMTTVLTLRPTRTGSYETDQALRLQCAELCGRDHATMSMPVRVVTRQEFEAWVRAQAGQAGVAPAPVGTAPN
jgi:cytochrome c oxidase subunit 2